MLTNDDAMNNIIYTTRKRLERSFIFNRTNSRHILPVRKRSLKNCQVNILGLGEQ